MSDTIRVVLPESYDLVVGDTFQLFYRGVVEAPDPYCYDILAVCPKGRNYPRYFELTPEEPGEYPLSVSVYDAGKRLLGRGETTLRVTAPMAPERDVHILCLGDSLTAGGQWPEEAKRRLTETGGVPGGHGFENIFFEGTCRRGETKYEGYGGWTWGCYCETKRNYIWVNCRHNKTLQDQHSLWQDENGETWVLETLEQNRLKFNPAYPYAPARGIPKGGELVHGGYAIHPEPIQIESCHMEAGSPLVDPETGCLDVAAYCRRNEIPKLDAVYILLGLNGWGAAWEAGMDEKAFAQQNVRDGKVLVAAFRKAFPEIRIRILGLMGCCVRGGCGTSYGARMPYCDDYGTYRLTMEMNLAYEAWAKEPEYRDFTEFINLSGQVDSENNMALEEKPVNTRSAKKELIGVNGAHPLLEGYLQIADAAYRNMIRLLQTQ